MTKPNIFKFATSELSQDAFICYVLDYYKDEYIDKYPLEYTFSKLFLNELLEKIGLKNLEIKNLKIEKQYMAIDILLIINESIYIIIEDKTYTSERKNQMSGYKQKVLKRYNTTEEKIYCLYYKIGHESYKNISLIEENKNTFTILRSEIINIFEKYSGQNIIFLDYLSNLKDIESIIDSFKHKDLRKNIFTWDEIIGFYNELDNNLRRLKNENLIAKEIEFNWQYTANKKGGFMCYYFENVLDFEKHSFYLQLECNSLEKNTVNENLKLVVKVWSKDRDISILYKGLDILKNHYGDNIIKPSRFAKGTWMTQGIIKDYIILNDNGTINSYETAKIISQYLKSLVELKDELKGIV